MKAVQIIFKVLLILALIAMCLVIIFVTPKPVVPDLNSGIQVIPEKDSTLVNANNSLLISPDSIPETDSDDAINLAYKMYLIANENMKNTDKWTTLVDCSTTMYIGSLFEIPVVGRRYYLKNGTEYYYTEYQVPGGGAGGLAGMAAPENSDFAMRSYTDISSMDFIYREKTLSPEFIDGGDSSNLVSCDWSELVDENKFSKESSLPIFHSSQKSDYTQTDQTINLNTIKNAKIEYIEENTGNFYRLTLVLDTSVPETTEKTLPNLRQSSGYKNAAYDSMVETVEIWENGYYKYFRSVDEWSAGSISSVIDYRSYFYYDDNSTNPDNYQNFNDIKQIALSYKEQK